MNFSWLNDFQALVGTRNFSRAADTRNMTQPAFSRRIQALEEWLGAELFDRSIQPIGLTETGEWFMAVAEDLLARVNRIPGEARALGEHASTRLTFAATHSLSFTFLPQWLRTMEDRFAVGPVQLISDLFKRCEKLAAEGKVQFLLSYGHDGEPGSALAGTFQTVRVGGDVLMCVSATDDRGQARFLLGGQAPEQEQMPVPYLGYSAESGIGRIVQRAMAASPLFDRMELVFQADLASVLRSMALGGRGVAWLPRSLILPDLENRTLAPAIAEQWNIPVDINLSRSGEALSDAAERFWACVSG